MTALAKPQRNVKLTKQEAQKRTTSLKRKVQGISRTWLQLGKEVRQCLRDRVPEALGMNAHAWMTMVFEESLAKIKRAVKIDVALAAIPEQKKLAMPESNAYELTKLPEKERAKPVWVNAAQNMPVAEFREKREKFIEEKFHVKREEWRTFAVRVPLAVYEKLIEAQVKVARLLELDIEDKPGNLIPVWEAIAALVNETPDERLVTEIEGKEDQCAAVGT